MTSWLQFYYECDTSPSQVQYTKHSPVGTHLVRMESSIMCLPLEVGGDRRRGAREKRGGRQENRGYEVEDPRWQEMGEIEKYIASFHYVLQ